LLNRAVVVGVLAAGMMVSLARCRARSCSTPPRAPAINGILTFAG
jgi:hypothetical protein